MNPVQGKSTLPEPVAPTIQDWAAFTTGLAICWSMAGVGSDALLNAGVFLLLSALPFAACTTILFRQAKYRRYVFHRECFILYVVCLSISWSLPTADTLSHGWYMAWTQAPQQSHFEFSRWTLARIASLVAGLSVFGGVTVRDKRFCWLQTLLFMYGLTVFLWLPIAVFQQQFYLPMTIEISPPFDLRETFLMQLDLLRDTPAASVAAFFLLATFRPYAPSSGPRTWIGWLSMLFAGLFLFLMAAVYMVQLWNNSAMENFAFVSVSSAWLLVVFFLADRCLGFVSTFSRR